MAPPAVRLRLAPTPEVPRARGALLTTAALFAPLLLSETAPVKSLAWVSVIAFAPAVNDAAPAAAACVSTPVCVIAPLELTVRVPVPTLDVPRTVAVPFVRDTAFAPLLFTETAPVRPFAWVSVIAFAPAVNDAVPAPAA